MTTRTRVHVNRTNTKIIVKTEYPTPGIKCLLISFEIGTLLRAKDIICCIPISGSGVRYLTINGGVIALGVRDEIYSSRLIVLHGDCVMYTRWGRWEEGNVFQPSWEGIDCRVISVEQ